MSDYLRRVRRGFKWVNDVYGVTHCESWTFTGYVEISHVPKIKIIDGVPCILLGVNVSTKEIFEVLEEEQ